MAKLNDLQTILLSSASQRPAGSLLPIPEKLEVAADRITKAIAALIKANYVDELPIPSAVHAWRANENEHYGLRINDAGRVAIGVEPAVANTLQDQAGDLPPLASNTDPAPPTKASLVLTLLQRTQGATLAELVEATGWLPHTTRAALTGMRKKGHAIAKGKRGDVTCYTLAA